MRCPQCRGARSSVIDSRLTENENRRRRHQCLNKSCGHRWSTVEVNVLRTQHAIRQELKVEYRNQIIDTIREEIVRAVNVALKNLRAE